VDRAKRRLTATVSPVDGLWVGLEYNPLADDLGPLVNWRVVDETRRRPALILGTSSDRIGTTRGRAYYATLSKDLGALTGVAVAPYAGLAYGEFDDELVGIGGLRIRWAKRVSSMHLWDSENLHHMLDLAIADRWRVGVMSVEQDGSYYAGLSVGASF
jgi:hypothetical protein